MTVENALHSRLCEEALALGADYFGVADLSHAWGPVKEQGGQMMAQFPRAISIGVMMPSAIVDQLHRQEDRAAALAYRSHSYDILNFRLDQIASRLVSTLQREGYRAFPVPASQTVNQDRLSGLFSHLLVTPEVGPRVRWASVLTDASLVAGQPLAQRCGGCTECVEFCPARAFTGRNFQADEPREARFDVFKCDEYFRQREKQVGARVCGMCVYVCPCGRGKG
jgi:epoxyqueuosine reductase